MGDKRFSVNLWGSKPGERDDCYTGDDFDTLAEAMEVYNNPFSHFNGPGGTDGAVYYQGERKEDTVWVELDGFTDPDGNNLTRCVNQGHDTDRGRREWQHEQAMEAGMLHGTDGYNEAMGYDNEEPWGESGSAF